MRIALGTFACSGLEAHLGHDVPAGVKRALCHYVDKLRSGRTPVESPCFLRDQPRQEPTHAFDLTLDPETEAVLEQEAARQGTTVGQLAVHSVLAYLAELDFLGVQPRH